MVAQGGEGTPAIALRGTPARSHRGLGRHKALPLRGIFGVFVPFEGVVLDVLSDMIEFSVIPDYTFVVVSLPEFPRKGRPVVLSNSDDVVMGCF